MTLKSRMFECVTRTWNPITGCLHGCVYCWARALAEGRLKNKRKYAQHGFKPAFHPHELKRTFQPGELVFVADMGDMWGRWVPSEWIRAVLEHIARFPETTFLFLTKNPARYLEFLSEMLSNVMLGATIETDSDLIGTAVSGAPPPSQRFRAMKRITGPPKVISVEPVLDFDLDRFADLILYAGPSIVFIGYDNYGHRLPEPPRAKVLALAHELEYVGIDVRLKTIRPAWWEQ